MGWRGLFQTHLIQRYSNNSRRTPNMALLQSHKHPSEEFIPAINKWCAWRSCVIITFFTRQHSPQLSKWQRWQRWCKMCRLWTGWAGVTTFIMPAVNQRQGGESGLSKCLFGWIYMDDKTALHTLIKHWTQRKTNTGKDGCDWSGLHLKTCPFSLQGKPPLTPQPKSYSVFPQSSWEEHQCLFGFIFSKGNMFLYYI